MIPLGKVFGEFSEQDVFIFNLWRTLAKWHAGPMTDRQTMMLVFTSAVMTEY